MIDNYLNAVEAQIRSERLIVTLEIERVHTSQITAYIEADAIFMDASRLVVFEHVRSEEKRVQCTDYRYHYMDSTNKLIFRYDNARPHPEIETFPDHKHSPSGVQAAHRPRLEDVMREIEENVVSRLLGES